MTTHALIAALSFSDGGPSERTLVTRGTEAECEAAGDRVPGIAYNGPRPGVTGVLVVRQLADADACAACCRAAFQHVLDMAPDYVSMIVNPKAPEIAVNGALQKVAATLAEYLGDCCRRDPAELVGYDVGAGLMIRTSDGRRLVEIKALAQREDERSVRWDALVDGAGAIVDEYATYEMPFLIRLTDNAGAACATCKRERGANPDCMACLEHVAEKGLP